MSQLNVHLNNDPSAQKTLNSRAPPAIHVSVEGETVPQRNYKLIHNMAGIEISELKDALHYAEFQLAKSLREKEAL